MKDKEAYREFKADQDWKSLLRSQDKKQAAEPPVVVKVREDVKTSFVCKFCGAAKRADVIYRADLSEGTEVVVEIECRAFVNGEKCGNVETRYY